MKFLSVLILILPLSIFAEEVGYQEGDSFKSKKSREVVLYQYKTDASRVNTALTFAFNLGDFTFDLLGAAGDKLNLPWLKRADQWWDDNSYRSTHPGHKLLRDASSVIIPSLVGGPNILNQLFTLIETFYLTRIYGNFSCDNNINLSIIENKMKLKEKINCDSTCHFEIWKR